MHMVLVLSVTELDSIDAGLPHATAFAEAVFSLVPPAPSVGLYLLGVSLNCFVQLSSSLVRGSSPTVRGQ